jgi:hypothetical protein
MANALPVFVTSETDVFLQWCIRSPTFGGIGPAGNKLRRTPESTQAAADIRATQTAFCHRPLNRAGQSIIT